MGGSQWYLSHIQFCLLVRKLPCGCRSISPTLAVLIIEDEFTVRKRLDRNGEKKPQFYCIVWEMLSHREVTSWLKEQLPQDFSIANFRPQILRETVLITMANKMRFWYWSRSFKVVWKGLFYPCREDPCREEWGKPPRNLVTRIRESHNIMSFSSGYTWTSRDRPEEIRGRSCGIGMILWLCF